MFQTNLELRAIVKGRVQRVGFRAKAKRLADTLHLTGTVRNLSDGSVEIYAQGKKENLDGFLIQLQQTFPKNWIEDIAVSFEPKQMQFDGFQICN